MTMQPERLYFAAPDANSTETRQAIAVVQYSVVTSRAPAIVAAVGGYFTGEIELASAVAGALAGFAAIFMRDALPKVVPVLLACVMLAGCGTTGANDQMAGQGSITCLRKPAKLPAPAVPASIRVVTPQRRA